MHFGIEHIEGWGLSQSSEASLVSLLIFLEPVNPSVFPALDGALCQGCCRPTVSVLSLLRHQRGPKPRSVPNPRLLYYFEPAARGSNSEPSTGLGIKSIFQFHFPTNFLKCPHRQTFCVLHKASMLQVRNS